MRTKWLGYGVASVLLATAAWGGGAPAGPGSQASSSDSSAVTIRDVQVTKTDENVQVQVLGTGPLAYKASRLSDPDRLVLDFDGARARVPRRTVGEDVRPVVAVRVGQFQPEVARVVIQLEQRVRYSVRTNEDSVTLVLAASSAPMRTKATRLEAPGQVSAAKADKPGSQIADLQGLGLLRMPLPETLTHPGTGLARQNPANSTVTPASAAAPRETAATSAPVQAQAAGSQGGQQASRYSGEPISVNLKDVDLKDFFRLIHEISGLNVVLDPNVRGSLTLVLDDVPWDHALDIVLQNNSLDRQLEGNVLRIATRDTLKKEAEVLRDLAKAQAEAVPPITTTRVLSYAKATSVRDTLRRFLSQRGEILADERSNMLIIRDIPSVLPILDNLISQLDRKSRQVEIEARVVAATRSFGREIGTQFGFAGSATGGRNLFGGSSRFPGEFERTPPPPLIVADTDGILPMNTNLAAQTPTSAFSFFHTSPNFALDFIITAAEAKGVGKLLSKPKVITQNNEKAEVKQGTKIPIQTIINNTISVQFIDAVLKLEVTPQITAEGTVFMDVVVENTAIDPGVERVNNIPALSTQATQTKVTVADGGTFVIGGVMISSQRTDVAQVPLLGSIPLVGHLFKRTTVNTQSQELFFFITPRIIQD